MGQVGEHILHVAVDAGGIVDGLGVQALVLCHVPHLGDLVNVLGIPQRVQGQLAVDREVDVFHQCRIGGLALTVQHAVAGHITRAALGELPLQRHVDAGAVSVQEQCLHGVRHIGQLAAVNGRKGIRLTPHRRGIRLFQRAQNDLDVLVRHGVQGKAAARNGQLRAAARPGQVRAVAAGTTVFGFHSRSFFSIFVQNKRNAFRPGKASLLPAGAAARCKKRQKCFSYAGITRIRCRESGVNPLSTRPLQHSDDSLFICHRIAYRSRTEMSNILS